MSSIGTTTDWASKSFMQATAGRVQKLGYALFGPNNVAPGESWTVDNLPTPQPGYDVWPTWNTAELLQAYAWVGPETSLVGLTSIRGPGTNPVGTGGVPFAGSVEALGSPTQPYAEDSSGNFSPASPVCTSFGYPAYSGAVFYKAPAVCSLRTSLGLPNPSLPILPGYSVGVGGSYFAGGDLSFARRKMFRTVATLNATSDACGNTAAAGQVAKYAPGFSFVNQPFRYPGN